MDILRIFCPEYIEEKLIVKHHVSINEVRQALLSKPRIRFAEEGHIEGENIYAAFGRTYGGRYLAIFFIYKPDDHTAVVISARDMTTRERKTYAKK